MSYKILFSKCYFFLFLIPSVAQTQNNKEINIRQYIDLSGQWQFCMDENNVGMSEKWFQKSFADSITLPGTLDENHKGHVNHDTVDGHLNRVYSHIPPAEPEA
jgi:beta-galactosidase/beta-glucuronidase